MAQRDDSFTLSERTRYYVQFTRALLRHPTWMGTLLLRGRFGLKRRVVSDSMRWVRRASLPESIEQLSQLHSLSAIGDLGGTEDYLYLVVRIKRPLVVVETGVHLGISTAFILAGLEDNHQGHLFSIDLPNTSYVTDRGKVSYSPVDEKVSTGFLVPAELRSRWTLLLGDSKEVLPQLLKTLGRIDIFLHDSEHTYEAMTREYSQALALMEPGGVLMSDDVKWNSAFADFLSTHRFSWSTVIHNRLGIGVF